MGFSVELLIAAEKIVGFSVYLTGTEGVPRTHFVQRTSKYDTVIGSIVPK